jgi:hypothetical protein
MRGFYEWVDTRGHDCPSPITRVARDREDGRTLATALRNLLVYLAAFGLTTAQRK